jgi:hypothetical protein
VFAHVIATSSHVTRTHDDECRFAVGVAPTNILIVGARDADVAAVQASVAEPVTVIANGSLDDLVGTGIIPDAVRLTRDQQDALRRRLEREPAVRVITLSAVRLYRFVEAGRFDETLYYRLTTITVEWPG